jgi:hypothetical protein
MIARRPSLDRFYELLAQIAENCAGKRRLAECHGQMGWPSRGVYFFFEDGETREDGVTPRVVRVGTHGLRAGSRATLWGRLSQHRGCTAGSLPGGGNHRGSIFRLHVGTAILASGEWPAATRQSWGQGNTAKGEVRIGEYALEQAVSTYIARMPFLWLPVDDPASASSDRSVIEAGAIALLSNLDRQPVDAASPTWLGRHANRRSVRDSGLWNVNHVAESPSPEFLDVLAEWIFAGSRQVRCHS